MVVSIRYHVPDVAMAGNTSNAPSVSDGLCMTASWKVAGGSCGKAASAASVTRLKGTDVLSTCTGGGRDCSGKPACVVVAGQHCHTVWRLQLKPVAAAGIEVGIHESVHVAAAPA